MINTPTLAEIYARQGHLEQAIGIYEALCAQSPNEVTWQERLVDLRGQLAASDDPAGAERARRIAGLRQLSARIQSRRREV